jgi:autonomous glycyl radical cofactor GrcA
MPVQAQGAALALGYDRTQVAQNGRSASNTQAYSISAARQIDGRNYAANYSRSLTEAGGARTETTVQGLTAPLSIRGTGVALAFNSTTTQQNTRVIGEARSFTAASRLNNQDLTGSWSRTQALADGILTENTVQGFSAPLSIRGTGLALAFNSNTTQQNGRVVGDNRSYTAATRLNNQDVRGSWSRTQALADGIFTENTVQGFNAPLRIQGTGLALAFNSSTTQQNQRVVADTRSLTAASRLNNKDVVATWSRVGATADNVYTQTATTNYQAPLSLLGTPLAVGFTASTVQQNGATVSDVRALNLASRLNNQDMTGGWGRIGALANGVYTETRTQSGVLPLRMLGTAVAVSFNSTTVQNNGVEAADNRNINVATRLGGQDLTASWARALNPVNGAAVKVTTGRFALPVSFFGEKLNLAYTLDALHTNNVLQSATRTASVAVPLARFLPGANYTLAASSYQAAGQARQQWLTSNLVTPISLGGVKLTTDHTYRTISSSVGDGHQWVTNAAAPLSLLGRSVAASGQFAEAFQPDKSGTQRIATDLAVAFKPGNLTISRVRATTIAAGGASSSAVATTNIAGPRVALNGRTSVQANISLLDQSAGDQRTTHVNVQANPTRPLTMEADYTLSEYEKTRSLAQHQLTASYALSQRLSLNTRYLEKEQLDQSPLIQRQLVLQRKATSGQDLSLRAALANVDCAAAEGDLLRLVELGFGDARAVALSMQYQEYNEADLAALAAPTVKVSLQHGSDSSLNWLFNYQDAAGRLEPQRQYGVGIPMGGGRLKVSLTQNPLDAADATGATIKRMDVYDASLTQRILGGVDVNVAYRCYDSTDHPGLYGNDLDQYVQLQVSGGQADGNGQVQISYANGEFVPVNATNAAWTPRSTLTVKYEKKWNDVGSLSLNLNRTNVPEGYAEVSDSYEGRLQFEYKF